MTGNVATWSEEVIQIRRKEKWSGERTENTTSELRKTSSVKLFMPRNA
jgi:hypothetical protein